MTLDVKFLSVLTSFSEGKVLELDLARSSAVWPEATDKQGELTTLIEARLIALMAEFRADMKAADLLCAAGGIAANQA